MLKELLEADDALRAEKFEVAIYVMKQLEERSRSKIETGRAWFILARMQNYSSRFMQLKKYMKGKSE